MNKYVFRGTNLGWPGNVSSQKLPRTSTTTNPVKAILFAMSGQIHGGAPVIFIALESKLAAIAQDKNVLAIVEDEIAFEIAPSDFPEYCEGYISLQDAIAIAGKIPLNVPQLLDRALFDMALKSTKNADSKETEQFFDLAKPLLKKR